jgi:FdhD protein
MPEDKSLEWVECTRVGAEVSRSKERVVTEFGLSLIVDGQPLTTAMITPLMKREFVVGHLFSRGIIAGVADIKSLTIKGDRADVALVGKGGRVGSPPKIDTDFRASRQDIFEGVSAILKSELYAETAAIHSAGLFGWGAKTLCLAEDIGRHNALDKVIGYTLINKIDLSHSFAASTGRMASDMVAKICRAGIPIVATKTAVTKAGVEIGQKCGLTVIGFVRDGAMKIYTHPQRVL